MKDVFYIFITLALAVVAYFTSLNIYIPIFVLLSFLLYYLLVGRKLLNKREQIVRRIHACYHFINAFIISMSVKESAWPSRDCSGYCSESSHGTKSEQVSRD